MPFIPMTELSKYLKSLKANILHLLGKERIAHLPMVINEVGMWRV